jgi:HK97 family phage major capsid protein
MPTETTPEVDPVVKGLGDIKDSLAKFASKTDLDGVSTKLQTIEQKIASISVGEPNVTKDAKAGFKHEGDYLLSIYKATVEHNVDDRLKILKGAGTPSGSSTLDFPLPAGFAPGIKSTDYAAEDLASLCTHVPIDAGQQSIELTYADDTDRSGGTIYGGVKAYTKSEAEQMTGTVPKKRFIKLEPQEIYAFAYATDKLLRNSPLAYGTWLMGAMQKALQFKKNDLIVNGTGNPVRGLLNSPDKITIAEESSQGNGNITHANVSKMWKSMPATWRSSAIWLANQDTEDQFDRMARQYIKNDATSGEEGSLSGPFNPDRGTLYGRPIVFSEFSPSLGTEGDLTLWCPSKFLVATKAGQGMEQSIHLRFDYAETAFRVIVEMDGKSEYPAKLTPYKGTTYRSSIVTLATRA